MVLFTSLFSTLIIAGGKMPKMFKSGEKSHKFSEEDIVPKAKKFVFHIYPENVKYVESMSFQERHDIVNELLVKYRTTGFKNLIPSQYLDLALKGAIVAVLIAVFIPLTVFLAKSAIEGSKSTNQDMQRKFENLYR
jgi:hypothetical protein